MQSKTETKQEPKGESDNKKRDFATFSSAEYNYVGERVTRLANICNIGLDKAKRLHSDKIKRIQTERDSLEAQRRPLVQRVAVIDSRLRDLQREADEADAETADYEQHMDESGWLITEVMQAAERARACAHGGQGSEN